MDGSRNSKNNSAEKKKIKRQLKRFHRNNTNTYPSCAVLLNDYIKKINKNLNSFFTSNFDADTTIFNLVKKLDKIKFRQK